MTQMSSPTVMIFEAEMFAPNEATFSASSATSPIRSAPKAVRMKWPSSSRSRGCGVISGSNLPLHPGWCSSACGSWWEWVARAPGVEGKHTTRRHVRMTITRLVWLRDGRVCASLAGPGRVVSVRWY